MSLPAPACEHLRCGCRPRLVSGVIVPWNDVVEVYEHRDTTLGHYELRGGVLPVAIERDARGDWDLPRLAAAARVPAFARSQGGR